MRSRASARWRRTWAMCPRTRARAPRSRAAICRSTDGVVESNELLDLLAYLGSFAARDGVRWALLGGVAANLYRDRPRLTEDVDVVLEVGRDRWPALADALHADGWALQPGEAYPDVVLLRRPDRLPVDVLIAKTEYQRVALDRAKARELGGGRPAVPVLTPEDIVIHKLIAGRLTDLDDVERILGTTGELDLRYVEQWVKEWGLEERWAAVQRALAARGGR